MFLIKILAEVLLVVLLLRHHGKKKLSQKTDDSKETSGGLDYHPSEEFLERQKQSGLTQLYAGLRMQLEAQFPDEVIEQIHPMDPVYNASTTCMRLKVITNKRSFPYFVDDTDHAKKLYFEDSVSKEVASIKEAFVDSEENTKVFDLPKFWFEPEKYFGGKMVIDALEREGYLCNVLTSETIEVNTSFVE